MSHRYSFRPLGIDSGGHLSVIALDPTGQKLAAGGDIQGFFVSEDFGDHWRIMNRGIWVDFWHRVAGVLWSTSEDNTIYGAVGDVGTSGGFMASTDGGLTWTRRSLTTLFAGNHTDGTLPSGHPRSTGNVLAQAPNGRLYAATYKDGVYASDDNGSTWSNIGFSGGSHYSRSIVLDPNDPNTLYVALYGEYIWKTTNATAASPSWTQLTNGPINPEELKIIGTYVYAAANTGGVLRSTNGGTDWTSLNGSYLDTTQSKWLSIDGYVNGSDHVVIVGCTDPVEPVSGQGYRSLVKMTITSGGSVSYAELGRDPSTVNLTIPPDNRSWWRTGTGTYKDWPSGQFNTPAYILIDPNNHDRIWVAGSSGVFRSTDGGLTWYMAVNGMALTSNRRLATDTNHPLRLLVGNTDWTAIEVTDGYGKNGTTSMTHAPSSAGVAYDVAIDPTDSTAFIAVGDRDNNEEGAVYSLPYGSSTWTNEGLENTDTLTPTVTDTFTRSTTDGWGSADTTQAWTVVNGPASNLATNGSQGTMQLAASTASRSIFLLSTSILDCSGTFDVSWDRAAAGGGHFASLYVRSDGTTNGGYAFRLDESTAGALNYRIHRVVTTATQIGSTASISGYTATSTIHVRFRVSGTSPTTLNMKAWIGDTEPSDWGVTITDSEATLQDAGSVGARAAGTSGYTAAALTRWDNLQIDVITAASPTTEDKRALGLAVGRDASNNRVLLAAVQENGLWRKVGGGDWSRVSTTICGGSQTSRATWFAWAQGSQYVYVFDRASGIYRSGDYGATWTQLWNITSDVGRTGFIALNPAAANELWVSTEDDLYKLSNANSGTVGSGLTATTISGVDRPSALAIDASGTVFCISLPDGSNSSRLMRSADGGSNWQDVSDQSFKAMTNRPADMTISPTGRIYVASLANGILIGNTIGQQQVS